MKNIKAGSIKHLVVLIVTIIIFGLVLYPLFDLLMCKFITNSEFVYSIVDHVVEPITLGTIIGIVLWVIEKNKKAK